MREILFRGKRKDNGEWVYGDLVHWWGRHNTKPDIQIYNNVQRVNVIPETVGQYTGLTDGNGKRIFEGDIVTSQYCLDEKLPYKSIIEYGVWDCGCCDGVYGWHCDGTVDLGDAMVIVIGNIHDNPELLEVEQ